VNPPLELDELPALQGRAWVLGDGVTTEQILSPAQAGSSGANVFSAVDPTLAERLAPGDFIVAGTDFGHGQHTATAARALRSTGVAAVIARSFGHEFLQAALDIGLPPLIVEETGAIKRGDRLRVDIEGHKVANLSSGDRYVIRNLYNDTLDVLRAGGRARYDALRGRAGLSAK